MLRMEREKKEKIMHNKDENRQVLSRTCRFLSCVDEKDAPPLKKKLAFWRLERVRRQFGAAKV